MSKKEHLSRRNLFVYGTAALSLAAFGRLALGSTGNPDDELFLPRPPGARKPGDFEAACTRCGLCVSSCPKGTLKLAPLDSGKHAGMPYFDPRQVPCYMCRDMPCVKVCPSEAIQKIKRIEDARMGVAAVDPSSCLSFQGLRCEVCYRECPVQDKAITIENRPREISEHAFFVPVIHPEHCTGCGLCVHGCPTDKPAINIVPRESYLGEIGEHYRLGWKEADDVRAVPDAPMKEEDIGASKAGGLDTLNGELQ